MSTSQRHLISGFVLALVVTLWGASCAVRPIPEPPSVDTSRMELVSASPDTLTLTGAPGSLRDGGVALRVANPRVQDRAQVLVGQRGDFFVVLRGVRSDVLYLELLNPTSDDYLVAITGGPESSVAQAPPGSDADGDDSPDAIDCAPDDETLGGSRCGGPACGADADCPVYQRCMQGACVTDPAACAPAVETCGNGLDEDCDGLADDGCPAGTACSADADCAAGQVCVSGVCTACAAETCGNGIDDDCDGQVDEGC